jgi:hypothetical protein
MSIISLAITIPPSEFPPPPPSDSPPPPSPTSPAADIIKQLVNNASKLGLSQVTVSKAFTVIDFITVVMTSVATVQRHEGPTPQTSTVYHYLDILTDVATVVATELGKSDLVSDSVMADINVCIMSATLLEQLVKLVSQNKTVIALEARAAKKCCWWC